MASSASTSTPTAAPHEPDTPERALPARSLAVVRIVLGWVFLWAFLDKTFGLGYPTAEGHGWADGASPTEGFLASRDGSFGELFRSMSDQPWSGWLFMGGLAGLGIALTLGIGLRVAAILGPVLMVTMWMSMLPLDSNPIVDVHIFYAVAMVALAVANAGDRWGLGRWWQDLGPVRRFPILR
ncbi:DoxX family membrane protein [Glycomyces arizonensis]|uniref:DoxX family membrane protein n=1 Tax=Glycomyces arizonensis TaxID=256035 RepID=UPI00042974E9|nr:DoxX family membrane protein [Glycomyces arizonensis]